MNKNFITFLLLLFGFQTAFAQPKPASIFSDNMVLQQNSSLPIWGWSDAGETLNITTSWNKKSYTAKANEEGEWKIKISTPAAGGPFVITINNGKSVSLKNVLIGDVWLCGGQSNMEMPMKGYMSQPVINSTAEILKSANNNIRLIKIKRTGETTPQDSVTTGGWKEAVPETVAEFSATGWFFGSLLERQLNIPIGLISCNWGGSTVEAWMNAEVLKDFADVSIPAVSDELKIPNRTATALYNGMLHPIMGFGIKGAIWYQGESNRLRPDQYLQLFPAMVKQWRGQWEMGEFPFYYVQIAPFNYGKPSKEKDNSAYLREAQLKSLDKIPNSGMAVIMDTGEEWNIHPANKKAAGHRLAYLALHQTYGRKGFGYASPVYDKLTIKDNVAIVHFKNAKNGLTTFGKPLINFEIAGEDKVFYPAKASISGASVKVSAAEVKNPVAVRYAFKDFVMGELFNTEGLPASSFRTDEW